MRYIAKKKGKEFEVSGIKEMEDLKGNKVEVLFATKDYDKKKLEEVMKNYEKELDGINEKYYADMADMKAILEAINLSK